MNFRLATYYFDFVTKTKQALEWFRFTKSGGVLVFWTSVPRPRLRKVYDLGAVRCARVQGTESICFPVSSLVFTAT